VLWCCPNRVTKPFALLTIGILVAQAVSGPVAAAFLAMNGLGGLHGWQWLFLLEGLPTVVLSGVVWFWLPDCPSSVPWLTEGDKKLHEASVSDRNGGAFGGGGGGCAGTGDDTRDLDGLHDWQWLFLPEGLLTVVLSGVVCFCCQTAPAASFG
jgi:MFS family permease